MNLQQIAQRADDALAINWRRAAIAVGGLVAFVLALVGAGMINSARADSLPKGGKVAAPAVAAPAARTWTGIYVGGFGTYAIGEVDFGAPINSSSNGQTLGGVAGLTVQTGQLVFGGEVTYAWMFGDLNDIGVNNEIEVTGKAGFLLMPNVLLYGHLGWARINTSIGDFDGMKLGPGVELRMADGWSLDGRAGYGWYDVDDIASGIDATVKYVRIGLNKRFDMPTGWFGQ